MTAVARQFNRVGIRPRLRRRELGLLIVVVIALTVGWISYVSYRDGHLELADTGVLTAYLVALFVIHGLFVISGRRMDEVLFPTAAMLAGISLLMMQRLPQDLVTQQVAGRDLGLDDDLRGQVAQEINVKEVLLAGMVDELAVKELKLNFPLLGGRP